MIDEEGADLFEEVAEDEHHAEDEDGVEGSDEDLFADVAVAEAHVERFVIDGGRCKGRAWGRVLWLGMACFWGDLAGSLGRWRRCW